MARKNTEQDQVTPEVKVWRLKKNHGLLVRGASQFYPAGSEFSEGADDVLIAQLHQSGAEFED